VYFPKKLIEMSTVKYYHRNRDLVVEDFNVTANNKTDYVIRNLLTTCFSYNEKDLLKMYDYSWWMNNLYSTGILKNIKSVEHDISDFFEKLDRMPFWKKQIENHRNNWKEAMIDGKIRSISAMRYWSKTLNRSDELMNIAENFEQAQDELGKKLSPLKRSLDLYNYGFKV